MTSAPSSTATVQREFSPTPSRPGDAMGMPGPQPDAGAPVTIVLVDDHAMVRQGLRALLEREPDLQVAGEASSPGETLVVVERTRPAIVLLDMKLSAASDSDGLGLCAQLTKRYPGLGVLVLSAFVDDALVVAAVQHGARGYVVKDVDAVELVRGR
jgi:DNA-binding NarL/FixJ family response regulator